MLTVAVAEDHAALPEQLATSATRSQDGWVLTGSKTAVPAGTAAAPLLVPADTEDGASVFLVRPDDAGVTLSPQSLSGGEVGARLELDGVRLEDDRRLGDGDTAVWLTHHLAVALAAEQAGVCAGALRLTSA